MLVPGDRLPAVGLGGGQAGAGAERPPVAGRVLEVVEEPVGEGLVPERLAVLLAVDGPPDPVPAAAGVVADLPGVPEPDVVTVHLLCSCRVLRVLFEAAQPRGQRAAPDPHPAAGQPHDCRPGSLPAPAVERGPRHPQLGGHLLDRQQRVIRGTGSSARGGGGPAGSGCRSRGRPVRGSATTDAPLRPPCQVRPPPGRLAGAARGPARGSGESGTAAPRSGLRGGAGGRRAARPCRRGRPAGAGAGFPGGDLVRALAVARGSGGRPCCRPAGRAGLPPGTAGIHPRLRPPRQVGPDLAPACTAGRRWPVPAARPGEGTPGGGQRVTLDEGTVMAGGPACRRFADSLHKSGFEGPFSPGHRK